MRRDQVRQETVGTNSLEPLAARLAWHDQRHATPPSCPIGVPLALLGMISSLTEVVKA
jgi:hypothetical protein